MNNTQLTESDALSRLLELGTRSPRIDGLLPTFSEVVTIGVAIGDADFGSIQLINGEGNLEIVAQSGFDAWWVKSWNKEARNQGDSNAALQTRRRIMVEDVLVPPPKKPPRVVKILRRSGVRAWQCTPLVSRSGTVLGILSTYYKRPRRLDGRILRLLDLLARQSADIIEGQKSEEALRESEQRFRRLVEQTPDGIFVAEPSGRYIDVNTAGAEMLGYSREEIFRLGIADVITAEEASRMPTKMAEYTEGSVCCVDWRFKRKDGSEFDGEVVGRVLPGGGYQGILRDTTRRKQAQEAFRQRSEELEALLDTLPAYVWVSHDAECRTITGNRAATEMTGVAVGTNVSQTMVSAGSATYLRQIKADGTEYHFDELPIQRAIATRRPVRRQSLEFRFMDGRRVETLGDAVPLFDNNGNVRGAVAVFFDITERNKLERALIEVSEKEQRKFGHELHDGLGQRLTALEMLSHRLAEDLKRLAPKLATKARLLNSELRETVTQARLFSHALAPVPLEGDGLMRALRELAVNTGRVSGVRCSCTCRAPVIIQNGTTASHLFRMAQEAVNNALRHGKAKRILITLSDGPRGIRLCVRNNGRTPRPERLLGTHGMGLNVMRYRAALIGGVLTIGPQRPKGATVTCLLRQQP